MTTRRANNHANGNKNKRDVAVVRFRKEHFGVISAFPPEVKFRLKTVGHYRLADITNSVSISILTNSLLSTSHGATSVAQADFLATFAKNWTSYRVDKYSLKLTLLARAVTASTLFSVQHISTDPAYATGTTFDMTSCSNLPETLASGPHLLGNISAAPNRMEIPTRTHTIPSIAGPNHDLDPAAYSGAISSAGVFTSPANPTYCIIHMAPTTGSIFVVSEVPSVAFELIQEGTFFDRYVV